MSHEYPESEAVGDAGFDEGLAQVEAVLAELSPRPARLDAARLLYLAGQESVAPLRRVRLVWLWPAVATVSTLAASVFGVLLALQPGPRVVERLVYVNRPAPAVAEHSAEDALPGKFVLDDGVPQMPAGSRSFATPNYFQTRNLAMTQGVDSLPSPPSGQGSLDLRPATYRELQTRILEGEGVGRRKLPEHGFYSWPSLFLQGDSL